MSDGIQVAQDFPPITDGDLKRLEVDPQLIRFIVTTVQRAEQSSNGEPQLSPTEAKNLVEILDKVVSSNVVNPTMKNRCFRVLRKVSPAHGILPKSYFLSEVTLEDSIPYASGGFADIWKGKLHGEQVCVKAFRTQTPANLGKIKRRFYRDIVAWKYVMHPNVVTFTGISETLFSFSIVYPWQKNGNIIEYTRKNQRVNRLLLLSQAACGLDYLHSLSIVHSAVNPGNILVDGGGNACLGDVGITGIITDPAVVEPGSTTTSKPGVVRYMSPELLNPTQFNLQNSNPTKESDVYSLAMTAYEVLTDILPYGNARDGIIIFRVVTGDRPTRPQNSRWLQDRIWDLIIKCWSEQREERWDVRTVYNQFSASSIQETAQSEREARSPMPGSSVAQSPPLSSSPPRQGMSADRVSIFVEDRGPTDLPNHRGRGSTLPQLQTQSKPAGRKSGARSQTAPPLQSPASTRSTPKKHFTFPMIGSPKHVETEGGPPHLPRQRKPGFSFATSRRLRKVVNVILGILRLRRAAKAGGSSSR